MKLRAALLAAVVSSLAAPAGAAPPVLPWQQVPPPMPPLVPRPSNAVAPPLSPPLVGTARRAVVELVETRPDGSVVDKTSTVFALREGRGARIRLGGGGREIAMVAEASTLDGASWLALDLDFRVRDRRAQLNTAAQVALGRRVTVGALPLGGNTLRIAVTLD